MRPAEGALAAPLPPPLPHRTSVTHAHMPAHVQHTIDRVLITDSAFSPRQVARVSYNLVYRLVVGRTCYADLRVSGYRWVAYLLVLRVLAGRALCFEARAQMVILVV